MTKTILFRADGNADTGLGHLYRLFSLVETVKDSYSFVYLTREDSTTSVIPEAYSKALIPSSVTIQEEPHWMAKQYNPENHLIIADGYQFVSAYQKAIKDEGFKLIYIDDLAKEHMYADIVINHSPQIKASQFSKESYTKLVLGTEYALLRPAFLEAAKQSKIIKEINTAFVCFGGADPFNLTLKVVQAFLNIPTIKKIIVVLGGAYRDKEILELQKEYSNTIKVYRNLSETQLINTMQSCNFAVVPASTILYEICCVKMPVLSGFYVDNQELIYKGFLENEAIFKGDNFINYEVEDFIKIFKKILKEKNFKHQIESQERLFDNKIALRHLNLIKDLC